MHTGWYPGSAQNEIPLLARLTSALASGVSLRNSGGKPYIHKTDGRNMPRHTQNVIVYTGFGANDSQVLVSASDESARARFRGEDEDTSRTSSSSRSSEFASAFGISCFCGKKVSWFDVDVRGTSELLLVAGCLLIIDSRSELVLLETFGP